MRKIIYTRPDGGVSVVSPAPGNRLALRIISLFGLELFRSQTPVPIEQISRKWLLLGNIEWAETEDEFLARIQARAVPVDAINPQIVDESVIPVDRTFRNALKQTGSALIHDMPKCRDIWRGKLRELRRPKMQALDVAYTQADERGDAVEKTRIVAEKQKLRDVTADPRIETAQTPEALKAVMPSELL